MFPFFQVGGLRGDRYNLRQATMVDLIAAAYGVDATAVQGGPIWLENDRFDIVAKAPSTTKPDAIKLMLQALLADRFKLVVHTGTKPMPAYVLTVGKGKPNLRESDGSSDPGCRPSESQPKPAPGTIPIIMATCHNMTMERFAQVLHSIMGGGYQASPVVDSTGLKGSWDLDLKWTPRGQLGQAGADGISIFSAVEKQLGLKLDLLTAPRPVLIVDSVNETPTANPPDLEKKLPAPPPAQFEVAVIKPSKPDATGLTGRITGGQVDLQYATLRFIIDFAWDLNPNDHDAIMDAPKSMDSEHYDILAKVANDTPAGAARERSAD